MCFRSIGIKVLVIPSITFWVNKAYLRPNKMCDKQLQKIEVDWKIAKTSIYFIVIYLSKKKKKKSVLYLFATWLEGNRL